MADYLTARTQIASILSAVSITTPVSAVMDHVYETPVDGGAVNRFPCVEITGYTLRYVRGPGGKRERTYGVGLRLTVKPIPPTGMHDVLAAFKEAISLAFDGAVLLTLQGGYQVLEGPNWTLAEPVVDGGTAWDEGEIVISIKDTATFTP